MNRLVHRSKLRSLVAFLIQVGLRNWVEPVQIDKRRGMRSGRAATENCKALNLACVNLAVR
jgi:hypothetical protein